MNQQMHELVVDFLAVRLCAQVFLQDLYLPANLSEDGNLFFLQVCIKSPFNLLIK